MRLLRRNCQRNFCCYWIIFIVLVIFYLEVVVYYLNSSKWENIECSHADECTKILLVADPQLIGKYEEVLHFLTPFTIFDSDRYLKKTYMYAYNFAKPDVVIFLGDLMDEASTADDKDFYEYVRRVFNIFLTDSKTVRHIWLPGDNDIGGENFDRITKHKISRFERAFKQPDLITIKNCTFFKVNALTQSIPVYKKTRDFYDATKIFIGLSHVPLMFMPNMFADKVLAKMLPQVLFTAHVHKSMIISTNALIRDDRHITPVTPDNNKIYEYSLGVSDMYEFIVPPCSYRMGTDKIGYGFAVLGNGEIRYTMLWSPARFKQLKFYCVVLTLFVLSGLSFYLCRVCRKQVKCTVLRRILYRLITFVPVIYYFFSPKKYWNRPEKNV